MKAVLIHRFGDASVLQPGDAPEPDTGDGDILIRLKAAALNHLDLWVRSGERERNIPLPHILGSDGAGTVARTGSAVRSFKEGDAVLISPGLSCGRCERCRRGEDNFCREYRVLGVRDPGTYAEYIRLPEANVARIPQGLSFTEAAAVPLVFLTAWHMLVTLARLREGETVLVQGAGSGVGSAAIQIAKHMRARVLTTAGSEEKLQKALRLGADAVINYRESDFTEEVKRLTEKRGVDVVFEHVGGEVLARSLTVLGRGGRLVTCGSSDKFLVTVDVRYIFSRQQAIYGSWMGGKPELLEVLKHFGPAGTLRPVVDSVFPLREASRAHERLESRKNFGKVVLEI